MALELFKPFVMKRLVDLELAQNIKSAKRMVERRRAQVWDVLEEVIKEHPVFLNRAPTLHRLGIQAFEPVLVEGKAIQIHPLVCTAFNADFDGDQMAVHLPLSAEAQAEARILMLSANNILSPATGRPIVTPTQDMVFGAYYLTLVKDGHGRRGPGLPPPPRGRAGLRQRRHRPARQDPLPPSAAGRRRQWTEADGLPVTELAATGENDPTAGAATYEQIETTAGRIIFNTTLPDDFPFVNDIVGKRNRSVGSIVEVLADRYPRVAVADSLDKMKDLTFRYAAQSGLTISINDVKTPPTKADIIARYEGDAQKAETQFKRGIITDDERRQKEIEIWTSANSEVGRAMEDALHAIPFNPLDMMVDSGARGNPQQVRQIAGMKGLVSNPRGEMIPRPILSSFREGLSVLEYFISTHGARKGLADTALRTADSGYLTRRLVDVAQELIIRELDCGSARGIWIRDIQPDDEKVRSYLETRIDGRVLVRDVDPVRRHRAAGRHADQPEDHGDSARRPRRSPSCSAVRCSPARPSTACAPPVTGGRWPPTSTSSSVRRSASSRPSPSGSPARSSPCAPSTPVVSPVRTSRTVCLASSSSSRPAPRRAPPCCPGRPVSSVSPRRTTPAVSP